MPPINVFFDGFVTHYLGFDGYRVVDGRRVQERGELQCHNVLVVDGLEKDIILRVNPARWLTSGATTS